MDFGLKDSSLRDALIRIAGCASQEGGRALLVGGAVRDVALGIEPKDFDIEVYGITPSRLDEILSSMFGVLRVGESFGVLKLRELPIDVSIPRRESKRGLGHRGFEVVSDPGMSPDEAASRRDFTMNSMMLDPLTGELLDPFGGRRDLETRVLRHTSAKFGEDPLRVLRGMQFAARFQLDPAPDTVAICQTLQDEGLARERIFDEWKKLILKGVRLFKGFEFLRLSGWLRYYPELERLVGCEQEPQWHPEGDVWIHTLHCMDFFAADRIGDEWEDLVVGFGVLCHDLGKPATTRVVEGRIRSFGHSEEGEAPTRTFLDRLSNQPDLVEAVVPLVTHHFSIDALYENHASDAAIRRLAHRVGRIDRLARVILADVRGRPPRVVDRWPPCEWLLERAAALAVRDSAPKPIMLGRHLIALGLSPGPEFKRILAACYEAQIEGDFATVEEGEKFVRTKIGPV